jgi:membrane protein required for colicin V production
MAASTIYFDAAIYIFLLIAIVFGFNAGLLRSLATIFGYVAAMGMALAAAPPLTQMLSSQTKSPYTQGWVVFVMLFLAAGLLLSAILRYAVSEIVGPRVSVPDRLAGATLGALRIGLLAVAVVLVFDRIIPPGREPEFLAGSRLRPIFSDAGKQGLRSLPPEVTNLIDRLKRQRGI